MQIVYRIVVDSSYFRAAVRHYYAQRPFLLRLETQFVLLLLPIGLWLLALWRAHPTELNVDVVGNAYITWLIMTAIGLPLTKWAIVQKLKQNGEFGTEVTVRLTDAGIEGTGRHTSGKWAWAAYPRSVRFADGILLQRSRVMRWLPDSAIEVGTPEEATTLVASKSNLRRISD